MLSPVGGFTSPRAVIIPIAESSWPVRSSCAPRAGIARPPDERRKSAMKPLSASEHDRRREFQIAAYIRLLPPPGKIPGSWRLLSQPHQGVQVPAPASRWREMSWWRWMRATG
jgi:hypothetical protein